MTYYDDKEPMGIVECSLFLAGAFAILVGIIWSAYWIVLGTYMFARQIWEMFL